QGDAPATLTPPVPVPRSGLWKQMAKSPRLTALSARPRPSGRCSMSRLHSAVLSLVAAGSLMLAASSPAVADTGQQALGPDCSVAPALTDSTESGAPGRTVIFIPLRAIDDIAWLPGPPPGSDALCPGMPSVISGPDGFQPLGSP